MFLTDQFLLILSDGLSEECNIPYLSAIDLLFRQASHHIAAESGTSVFGPDLVEVLPNSHIPGQAFRMPRMDSGRGVWFLEGAKSMAEAASHPPLANGSQQQDVTEAGLADPPNLLAPRREYELTTTF